VGKGEEEEEEEENPATVDILSATSNIRFTLQILFTGEHLY